MKKIKTSSIAFLGRIVLLFSLLLVSQSLVAVDVNEAWVKQHYQKREVNITMRDGIQLYTAIYEPVSAGNHPIVLVRTPYSCSPYGPQFTGNLWGGMKGFVAKDYILVYQDVRGRRMSEGTYENVRPISVPAKEADDVTDTYDTADWLLKNTHNNGRIGLTGNSYLGYYALTAAISAHPAIKAICAQAPIGDWFMGDDIHHNGALMLTDAFGFLSGFDRPRTKPSVKDYPHEPYYETDERSFFLKEGTLQNLTKLLNDSVRFWTEFTEHPNYDSWWQARSYSELLKGVKAKVMVVGGLFDSEDLYGTLNAYRTLKRFGKNPYLLMGPWVHGGWARRPANSLGGVQFSDKDFSQLFYDAQQTFFDHELLTADDKPLSQPSTQVFFTGINQWRTFAEWPLRTMKPTPLYLHKDKSLSFVAPKDINASLSYRSDPNDPVPYTATVSRHRKAEYMNEDQQFAEQRQDVLTFKTAPLKQSVTLGGPVVIDLWTSISTTDADFVVKLIDVSSDDGKVSERLVRGDIMRGRFRNSFVHPLAFVPGQITKVSFTLTDVAHTFLPGHRLMIQVQSSWFPLADMNPQKFVDIYHCSADDFTPSDINIYMQKKNASKIILPIIHWKNGTY